ncbi:MAG: hypothetical protein AAGJ83_02930 [Planctomycetota bacterium]
MMKIAKTPLESIRVKWTLYGVACAIVLQVITTSIAWYRGKPVDWLSVLPTGGAVFAVVFAVHGAVYAAASLMDSGKQEPLE